MFDHIEFVPFDVHETRTLYEIRNHESVRRFMTNEAPIDYASHEAWVRRHLVEEKSDEVFFIHLNGEIRGFVLIRARSGREAEFGIMLAGGSPPGLGAVSAVLFLDYAFDVLDIDELRAKIVRGNANSIRTTLGIGGCERGEGDRKHRHFVFSRTACRASARFVRLLEHYRPRCAIRCRASDRAGD